MVIPTITIKQERFPPKKYTLEIARAQEDEEQD
jgi:hypothetical protein